MNTVTKTAIATLVLVGASLSGSAAVARAAAPKAPHACSSHSVKVVTAKCADRNRDGIIEYLSDGTTR